MCPSLLAPLWSQIAKEETPALVLDYDGTLAPFQIDRMKAFPLPGVTEILAKISNKSRLAILSGRPISELVQLIGDVNFPLIGSHGFEYREKDGIVSYQTLLPGEKEALDKAQSFLHQENLQNFFERKPASIALHVRGLDPKKAQDLLEKTETLFLSLVQKNILECRRFDGGVELRSLASNKGSALQELCKIWGNNVFCVYIGDDNTDEDAFAVLTKHGFGIRVGKPAENTSAKGFLKDPSEVLAFLKTWKQKIVDLV